MVKRNSLICILGIFLIGCNSASPSLTPASAAEGTDLAATAIFTVTAVPEYMAQIKNAPYQLGATDSLIAIQLADGKYQRGVPGDTDYLSVTLSDLVAVEDLDNDGKEDVAAVLAENYGGSGVFTFLAVYKNAGAALQYVTSVFVDDRPGLHALDIDNDEILLDATLHKTDDPLCCPTLHTLRRYRLWVNDQLDLSGYTSFTPDDRPRTIVVESPLNGVEVNSVIPIRGSVAIAPFENNLVYRIYDTGGVELAAGAVPVSAAEPGGPGTFDTAIVLGHTLSNALIRIEIQNVSAEDGSLLAMDSVELVVK